MSVTYYAGVVGYTGGPVSWSLSWAETSPGTAPVLTSAGLPANKIGVIFADPTTEGGARGVATLNATVNGLTAVSTITATVEPEI